eukprot:10077019-Alexandrium_andersonii.AAC.1
MSASLVGSEMCIRDRCQAPPDPTGANKSPLSPRTPVGPLQRCSGALFGPCLLYTSDAADDM